MIKKLLKIIILILIAVIQITLMPHLAIHGVWPNLLLILMIMLIFFNAEPEALLTASVGGLMLDLSSTMFFGFFTISMVIMFLIIKILANRFLDEPNLIIVLLTLFLSLIVWDIFISLVLHQFGFSLIMFSSLYGLGFGLVFYKLLSIWIDKQQAIKLI